jgi:hypothetical protein
LEKELNPPFHVPDPTVLLLTLYFVVSLAGVFLISLFLGRRFGKVENWNKSQRTRGLEALSVWFVLAFPTAYVLRMLIYEEGMALQSMLMPWEGMGMWPWLVFYGPYSLLFLPIFCSTCFVLGVILIRKGQNQSHS